MDVVETPLNTAHQRARAAECHLLRGAYTDAALAHQQAADLLAEAAAQSASDEARRSLELQRQHHLRQKDVVKMKERRAKITQQASGPQTYTIHDGGPRLETSSCQTSTDGGDPPTPTTDTTTDVYRTLTECDSLLQFLNHRQSLDHRSLVPPNSNTQSLSGSKTPKDESMIIEELKTHNDALRKHVLDLLTDIETQNKDLDHYRSENARLHGRLRVVERSNQSGQGLQESTDSEDLEYHVPVHLRMNLDDLTSIELPPLEMPKFDMDVFKESKD